MKYLSHGNKLILTNPEASLYEFNSATPCQIAGTIYKKKIVLKLTYIFVFIILAEKPEKHSQPI